MTLPSISPTPLYPSVFQTLLDSLFPPAPQHDPIILPSGQSPIASAPSSAPMVLVCNMQPSSQPYGAPADPIGSLLNLLG